MTPGRRCVRVVAALITTEDGRRVLVQRRPAGKTRGLLWEFPGGKVEPGESDAEALRRECREELGVELAVGAERFRARHAYPDLEVDLHVYAAAVVSGQPRAREDHLLRFVPLAELRELPFCEADGPLVDELGRGPSDASGRLSG
ncbi:MAG TPA: (deoxy)nucleoside triphosphate pyrophosphohydrolase [Myxococcaceae bacterium]|nr:(deoxy)nucleoside triphosphate pyrophosphohydrolase [Myxococcaceae bacterium]